MTTKRVALCLAAALMLSVAGAGVYATAQNTNQDPAPFMGRGRGAGVPGGRIGGPGAPMGMLPMLPRELNLSDAQMEGTWRVNTSNDDDFIGFVFGYQNSQHFYLFDWKQADQNDTLGFRCVR